MKNIVSTFIAITAIMGLTRKSNLDVFDLKIPPSNSFPRKGHLELVQGAFFNVIRILFI